MTTYGDLYRRDSKSLSSLYKWWVQRTKGRSGLLVLLVPAMISQMIILRTAVPFLIDRLSQYLQPLYIGTLITLFQPQGPNIIKSVLLSGIAIGGMFMLIDTYQTGSSWVPLQPQSDSYAVVTGASSGIGLELAKLLYIYGNQLTSLIIHSFTYPFHSLSILGYNVVLIARHATKLQNVKEGMVTSAQSFNSFINQKREAQGLREGDISYIKSTDTTDQTNYTDANIQYFSPPDIKIISCDLAEKGGPAYAMKELKRLGIDQKVDVLVNCAGYAIQGRVISNPIDSLSDIIDLNLKSTVTLTRLLAPRIAKRGNGGRILLVGSLASLGPAPDLAIYTATKAFLSSFAASLRREMMPLGVLVSLGIPGPTESEFAKLAGMDNTFMYRVPGIVMSSERTARALFAGIVQGRDVIVPGILNKIYAYGLARVLPAVALGGFNKLAVSTPPNWLPFLKPSKSTPIIIKRPKIFTHEVIPDASEEKELKELKAKKQYWLRPEYYQKTYMKMTKLAKRYALRFWYSPIINYDRIKQWIAEPFRKKGQDIDVDGSMMEWNTPSTDTDDTFDEEEEEEVVVDNQIPLEQDAVDVYIESESDDYNRKRLTLQKIIEKLKRKLKEQQEFSVPREEYYESDRPSEYNNEEGGGVDESVGNGGIEENIEEGEPYGGEEMEFNYN